MRYLTWLAGLAILWVIIEYIFVGSSRSIPVTKYINIHIDEFKRHDVVMVQHQQIPFVLVHRTSAQVTALKNKYKINPLRSLKEDYFIALAIGTDFGCIVSAYNNEQLKETCSTTTYDYSGRSSDGNYEALKVPEMTYNQQTHFFNMTMK